MLLVNEGILNSKTHYCKPVLRKESSKCPVRLVHRINCEEFWFLAWRGDASLARPKLRSRNKARGQKNRNSKE